MADGFRIRIAESELFPVQAFFNAIPDDAFLAAYQNLSDGVGAHFNEVHCQFPTDLDPGELIFEGVKFSILEYEVIITLKDLRYYAELAAKEYLRDYPEDRLRIPALLEKMNKD